MKRTKQILSIFIAVVMLAALFSIAAQAAPVEEISVIELTGVCTPEAGRNPDSYSGAAAYDSTFETILSNKFSARVSWYNSANNEAGNFVAGNNYTAKITVTPKEGYTFSREVTAYVNGNVASAEVSYPDVIVQYTFTAREKINHEFTKNTKPATFTEDGYSYEIAKDDANFWRYYRIPKIAVVNCESSKKFTYNGKKQIPKGIYFEDADGEYGGKVGNFTETFPNSVNAGKYTAKVHFINDYSGDYNLKYEIVKAKNPIKVTAKNATVKYSEVKRKNVTVSVLTVKKAQGNVTYKKLSGNKKITVNSKTGKVTVKKGTPKGTYSIKAKVTVAGNKNYNSGSVTKTFKIKVK